MRRSIRVGRAVAVLAMPILLVAACAGPAGESLRGGATPVPTSAPSSTDSSTPTPTRTPLETERALLEVLRDPTFTARVTIRGTETIPSGVWTVDAAGSPLPMASMPPTVLAYEGEAYIAGDDHLVRLQVTDAPNLVIWEHRRDGTTWRRTWLHPWQEMPAGVAMDGPRLFDLLAEVVDLEPGGSAPDTDGLVHFVVPAVRLDLVRLWLQEAALKEPDAGTIEILAETDGTPVKVLVHLASDDLDYSEAVPSGVVIPPREYDFEYELSAVGERIELPVLDPPTEAYTSADVGLTVDVPLGWRELEAGPWEGGGGSADIGGPGPTDGEYVQVRLLGSPSSSGSVTSDDLDGFARWALDDLVEGAGMELMTVETMRVAGQPAYLLTLLADTDDPPASLHQEAIFTDGTTFFVIAYRSPAEPELQARFEFDQLLGGVGIGG